jgi:hypothetical protein
MGAVVATAAAAPRATTAMTAAMRATEGTILRAGMLSLYRCLHWLMIIAKKTRRAIKSHEALRPTSWGSSRSTIELTLQAAVA